MIKTKPFSASLFLLLMLPLCWQLYGCAGCSSTQANYVHYADEAEAYDSLYEPVDQSRVSEKSNGNVVVKMKPDRGIYKIPVSINGFEMDFYFDTGAGMISLSEVEVAFLLKQGKITQDDVVGSAHFTTANGERSRSTIIKLKDVTIGNRTIHDVEASVVNNADAPLLLGQSFLSKFGKISIDYETNEISFR